MSNNVANVATRSARRFNVLNTALMLFTLSCAVLDLNQAIAKLLGQYVD
ncbi:MAG: hypothetical protein WCA06_14210 [Terrimicrobiaceae bacterium]